MGCCLARLVQFWLPPAIPYDQAKTRTRSLDLVYFLHPGVWTSPLVMLTSGAMISHMGVVWRHPRNGELFLLESVRSEDTLGDVVQGGRRHTGVRLVHLRDKLNRQEGGYYVCVQPIEMETTIRAEAEEIFNRFIIDENGIPFEQTWSSFALAQLPDDWRLHAAEDTTSLYCSELAALALRTCRVIPDIPDVSAVWPPTLYDCQLRARQGAQLSVHKFLIQMNSSVPIAAAPPATEKPSVVVVPSDQDIESVLQTLSRKSPAEIAAAMAELGDE